MKLFFLALSFTAFSNFGVATDDPFQGYSFLMTCEIAEPCAQRADSDLRCTPRLEVYGSRRSNRGGIILHNYLTKTLEEASEQNLEFVHLHTNPRSEYDRFEIEGRGKGLKSVLVIFDNQDTYVDVKPSGSGLSGTLTWSEDDALELKNCQVHK